MTNEMLRDAFEELADEAHPVDDLAGRALRRLDARRRNRRVTGVVLAIASAVAVPWVVFGPGFGGEGSTPDVEVKPKPRPLPADTRAEAKVTLGCMRDGVPRDEMGRRRPDLGKVSDFRLLVRQQVGRQFVAAVGTGRGFVTCVGAKNVGNVSGPMFHPWQAAPGGDLWAFRGKVRLDRKVSESTADGHPYNLHQLVFGRVKPEVARLTVYWNRNRKADAAVQNGFFIARTHSRVVPAGVPGDNDIDATGMSDPDDQVTKVVAYNAAGRVVSTMTPPFPGM
ncbi:hypothetical protein [Actinomadura rudentiformis]|uniref:Uncharacterized protein n=1 Tax=Actinomadura rudentiformis TaxID=359158 RepID=A0A6H9YUH6_9ACTN|nr:hypothetical protein [Actinomadura rudentiformis]KAB2352267.1 hypothetical protein F8566_00745 [Actinomadura rudentiformis]